MPSASPGALPPERSRGFRAASSELLTIPEVPTSLAKALTPGSRAGVLPLALLVLASVSALLGALLDTPTLAGLGLLLGLTTVLALLAALLRSQCDPSPVGASAVALLAPLPLLWASALPSLVGLGLHVLLLGLAAALATRDPLRGLGLAMVGAGGAGLLAALAPPLAPLAALSLLTTAALELSVGAVLLAAALLSPAQPSALPAPV